MVIDPMAMFPSSLAFLPLFVAAIRSLSLEVAPVAEPVQWGDIAGRWG